MEDTYEALLDLAEIIENADDEHPMNSVGFYHEGLKQIILY